MQAVILAGGFGTRLQPLTFTRPKPLMPIINKPMIMHIIDKLPKEIDKVLLAVNYKKEQLEQYFENYDVGIEVKLIEEKEALGTGGAIKNLEKYINGTFLCFNGDIITSLDISKFLKFHKKKKGIGTIALREVEDPTAYGVIGIDENNKIYKFLEKPKKEEIFSNLINAGTYVLEQDILDFIESGKKVSIEREVYPFVLDKSLFGYKFEGYWVDVGRLENYLTAHKILMDENVKSGKEKIFGQNVIFGKKSKIIPPVVIGDNCKIDGTFGPYACIDNFVYIENDVRISNSVIFSDSIFRENSKIEKSIVGEGCKIFENATVFASMLGDCCVVKKAAVLRSTKVQPNEIRG